MRARPELPLLLALLCACGTSGTSGGEIGTNSALPNTSAPYLGAQGPNVLSVTVGGSSFCGKYGYPNEPCASATLCVPGTSQCQTITDLLVDTGSVGLRVFSSVLTLPLPQISDSSGHALAECAQFGTGSDWGPLATADVVLGNEPAVTVPVQIIDQAFASAPEPCARGDTTPQAAGYNGILGVGLFNEDCGPACAVNANAHVYYACAQAPAPGPSPAPPACSPIAMPQPDQVQNPVSYLPVDNNGILLAMPQVGPSGAPSASGALILGIGTASNNSPAGVSTYAVDPRGNFVTRFGGSVFADSFIDSGSNGLFFPNATGIQSCSPGGPAPKFYCPSSLQSMSASNVSASGNIQASVGFQIANAESLVATPYFAFSSLGGENPNGFDWGLPFFYGRAVFIGLEGRSSVLGSGLFVAY